MEQQTHKQIKTGAYNYLDSISFSDYEDSTSDSLGDCDGYDIDAVHAKFREFFVKRFEEIVRERVEFEVDKMANDIMSEGEDFDHNAAIQNEINQICTDEKNNNRFWDEFCEDFENLCKNCTLDD